MPTLLQNQCIVGQRVRVIGAPERQGTIRRAAVETDGEWYVRVAYDEGDITLTPLNLLEPIPESIDVLDEVESGAFQGPESLRRNLLHEKLHGRLSDIMYSMDTSDTSFHAYQFKPVLKLLESPTNSLLIADEVGLGKTIEAGLIWTEIKAREGARTLLVVCPPHLVTKWARELKRRFGVDSRKVGAEDLLELLKEAASNRSAGFALIATYHGLRPPKQWSSKNDSPTAQLAQQLFAWGDAEEPFLDLLVMDEAAIMRNESSQTSELGGLLTPIARHKVYLSATPLHTRARNLFTLLKRLDPDTFTDEQTFANILATNEPLVALREALLKGQESKEALLDRLQLAMNSPLLAGNHTLRDLHERIRDEQHLADPKVRALLAYQSERVNLLSYVVSRTRRRDVSVNSVTRKVHSLKVSLNPVERELYEKVTAVVYEYSEQVGISSGFLTVMPQRQVTSCFAAAYNGFNRTSDDNDEINPDTTWDTASSSFQNRPLIQYIHERLSRAIDPAYLSSHDSKYATLRGALQKHWEQHPDSKVIIFAYFKPTLKYLQERLRADGIESIRLTGDDMEDKQIIVDRFALSKSAMVLLSSEVGSEGFDLQFSSVVVNYDLPWNPMVVEQRIGRIHRIGQKADRIVVMNLVCEGTVDERIYDRLYIRLRLFERTLGDLEAVIGPLINSLTDDLFSLRLSPEEQSRRIEQTAVAMETQLKQEEELERQASTLAAYGDYVIHQITAAHERGAWVKGDDLEDYVLSFFRRIFPATRVQGTNQDDRVFEIEMDAKAIIAFDDFLSIKNLRGQTRLSNTERHSIRFDHRIFASAGQRCELIHQAHPLIRFIGYHLRTEKLVNPVAVAVLVPKQLKPANLTQGNYGFVTQRWTVDGVRIREKIHHQVINLESGNLLDDQAAVSLVEIAAALGNEYPDKVSKDPEVLSDLSRYLGILESEADVEFSKFLKHTRQENEDRQQIQLRGVEQFEARRTAALLNRRNSHIAAGRKSLIAAAEGQIEKLRKKCEIQRIRILSKRTTGENSTIGAGIILVL